MRAFIRPCLIALLALCASSSGAQVNLSFSRTGTNASSVKVQVTDGQGQTLNQAKVTLTSSHAFKATANDVTSTMLCPNVNGNTSPTITLTFKIEGLSNELDDLKYALLDLHALNASGKYQSNGDGVSRQYNVKFNGGNTASANEVTGDLTDIDIAKGIGDANGVHQVWTMPLKSEIESASPFYLRLTITAGTANKGCFLGLTSISLANKLPEKEVCPFQPSKEIGSPEELYTLLTPQGQALEMDNNGTLRLVKRTDNASQTWYFVGESAERGGYLMVNALNNTTFKVSESDANHWIARVSSDNPAYFYLSTTLSGGQTHTLKVDNDSLFCFRHVRNAYSRHAQIYDVPCGALGQTYITKLRIKGDTYESPLFYPLPTTNNNGVVEGKTGKPSSWYVLYTLSKAQAAPGKTFTISGELNEDLADGETLTAYFDWNRDGVFETSVSIPATNTFSQTVQVPEDANAGESRVRLRLTSNGLQDAEDDVAGMALDAFIIVLPDVTTASVTAYSCDTLRGTVAVQPQGESFLLTATPLGNAKFLGWYRNREIVSTQASFELQPIVNGQYVAMFSPNTESTSTAVLPTLQDADAITFQSVNGNIVASRPVSHFRIYTTNGRLVQKKDKTSQNIDCSRLPQGTYMVVARNGNANVASKVYLNK